MIQSYGLKMFRGLTLLNQGMLGLPGIGLGLITLLVSLGKEGEIPILASMS